MNTFELVICTHNRLDLLKKNLVKNTQIISEYNNVEMTVVDSNSSDGTYEYLKNLPLRSYFSSESGLSIARNLAIANIRSDYLIFIDDDIFLSESCIPKLNQLVEFYKPEIVGGSIKPLNEIVFPKWFDPKWETRLKSQAPGFTTDFTFSGGNLTIASIVFQKIGIFDPNLGMKGNKIILGEEKDFMNRYYNNGGINSYYDPDLFVWTEVLPYKLRYSYRLRRELSPLVTFKGRGLFNLLFKPTFYSKIKKRVHNLLKKNNFYPTHILDRIRYLTLVFIRAVVITYNKKMILGK